MKKIKFELDKREKAENPNQINHIMFILGIIVILQAVTTFILLYEFLT